MKQMGVVRSEKVRDRLGTEGTKGGWGLKGPDVGGPEEAKGLVGSLRDPRSGGGVRRDIRLVS